MPRSRRILTGVLVVPLAAALTAWSAGALYYSTGTAPGVRTILAFAFIAAVVLAFVRLGVPRALAALLVAFGLVLVWWLNIPASGGRDWQPDVSVAPSATLAGDLVTIHGVRNFDYRTETDFDARWETRTYDVGQLDSVDLIAVYWAGKAIAHIMLSFGFADRDYLTVSIETRKERNEQYSALAGFFRQYELVYIVGDERDLIRVRTTYRSPQEDVYVYRVRAPRENIRRAFLDYVKTMNDMQTHPRFYNTLTTNCTTGVLLHSRVNRQSPPWSWKVVLSGYVPEYLYDLGRLETGQPFAELERLSHVNARAHAADQDPAFSRLIREGLPRPAAP
jgi:Domain of unknown function (DUF4105)